MTLTEVVRVVADLRDGRRTTAFAGGGWFVFTQDIGHAPPIRLTAYDAGRRVGRPRGLLPGPVPAPRTAPAPTPSP